MNLLEIGQAGTNLVAALLESHSSHTNTQDWYLNLAVPQKKKNQKEIGKHRTWTSLISLNICFCASRMDTLPRKGMGEEDK